MRAYWFAAVIAACTQGAPPGFSGGPGDRWTFPLVGALENGLLVTPVSIGSHGPYLFAIDPDSPITVVDGAVVKEAQLRTQAGPHRLDESDTQQPRIYAEIVGLEIGTLVIERRDAIVVKAGTYDSAGRRIYGLIGRDVLADSLVFGFDRDAGVGYLVTAKAFHQPPDSIAVPYEVVRSMIKNASVLPVPRQLVKATVNDQTYDLHVDLGATASQLRESLWDQAKLTSRDIQAAFVDEVGSLRKVAKASEPVAVKLGAAESPRVAFVPYGDKRWDDRDVAGTLGLGFFAPYDVWNDFDGKKLYLVKRVDVPLAQRVTRWETGPLEKCQNPGCVTVRLVDPLGGKPVEEGKQHPGVVLSLTRDERAGGMPLEVVLEAKDKPELPLLIANMPANTDKLIDQLDPRFLGAQLVVLDASPYPRECPGKVACVDKLAR